MIEAQTLLVGVMALALLVVDGFTPTTPFMRPQWITPCTTIASSTTESTTTTTTSLSASSSDYALLQERVEEMRLDCLALTLERPPSQFIKEPEEFCQLLLGALKSPDDPYPDSGYRTLIRSSTDEWRKKLYRAVGAPLSADMELVASSLANAVSRSPYSIIFHTDIKIDTTVVMDDNSCWVACELNSSSSCKNSKGRIVMGLSLLNQNGCWLLHDLDFNDFTASSI